MRTARRVVSFWVKIGRKSWEVLKESWGNYTNEFLNELITWMYLWRFWMSSETIWWNFVFIFAPCRLIPKGSVLNRNTALFAEFTGNSCVQLFYKRHLLSKSGFTETYLLSACVQFLTGQKQTKFACPAVNFDRLMKNKLMWILHI